MNIRIYIAALVVAASSAPAAAQDATTSFPAVKVEAALYVADCNRRVLPTQREVGEWTGQNNFSQVYDTREHLMAAIGRACQQDGIEQVQVVSRTVPAPRDLQLVAIASRRGN